MHTKLRALFTIPNSDAVAPSIAQIDERLSSTIQRTRALEQYLWDVSTAAAEVDVKTAMELRERGLILGTEVPLGPSHLDIDPAVLADTTRFGDLGKGLVCISHVFFYTCVV